MTPEHPLNGDFDPAPRLARVPRRHVIKGLFCQSLVDLLEGDWPTVRERLKAPPEGDRYEPMADYPQVDYCRIALGAARRLFPDLPLAEAARRLGRQDLMVFASSPLGRTLFEPRADLAHIFARLPELYKMVIRGGKVQVELRDDRCADVRFRGYHGWVDCYTVGTVEGIVQHYDCRPTIRVTLHSPVDADYLVCWE